MSSPTLPEPHDFALTTADNVRLAVSRWRPQGEPLARIVLAHGFTATRQTEAIQRLAAALVFAGADLTIHDARGHGQSAGATTLGNAEQQDVAAVVAHVAQVGGAGADEGTAGGKAADEGAAGGKAADEGTAGGTGADEGTAATEPPLFLFGISMGAIASANYLAGTPDNPVDALVLISSPAYWRARPGKSAVIMTFLTRTPLGRWFAKRRMDVHIARKIRLPEAPARAISKIEVPIGVIGGKEDLLLGTKAAQRIFDMANEPKKLALIAGAGHSVGEEAISACVDMLDWLVEQTRAQAAARAHSG